MVSVLFEYELLLDKLGSQHSPLTRRACGSGLRVQLDRGGLFLPRPPQSDAEADRLRQKTVLVLESIERLLARRRRRLG